MTTTSTVDKSPDLTTEVKRSYWQLRRELGKPTTRGMLHLLATPLALANAIVLIVFADGAAQTASAVVFLVASLFLFGISALYHLGNWSPKNHALLRKFDHANIFVLIAGSYTPISVSLLSGTDLAVCLGVVFGGSIIGSLMYIFWDSAPRWLYVALYIIVGWVAIWYLPQIWEAGTPAIVWLVIAGGVIYTIGAVFYGTKWPNPWPNHWGFHEFFHLATVLAYACHAVAIWLAYSLA